MSPVLSGNRTQPNMWSIQARQYWLTVCSSASFGQWPNCCRSQLIGTPEVRVAGPAAGNSLPRNASTLPLQPSDRKCPVTGRPLILSPRIFWTSWRVTVISPHGMWKVWVSGLHLHQTHQNVMICCDTLGVCTIKLYLFPVLHVWNYLSKGLF